MFLKVIHCGVRDFILCFYIFLCPKIKLQLKVGKNYGLFVAAVCVDMMLFVLKNIEQLLT